MVTKKIIRECFVSIIKNFKRFISLLLIILLGVGFFAGIRATAPDMKLTLDSYFEKANFYDLLVMSNYGINKEELKILKNNNYNIEGSYSFDAIIKADEEAVVKVLSYDKFGTMNKLDLKKGRLPQNNHECVIEKNKYTKNYNIGDTILVENNNLKEQQLKIVGIITSPLYISQERGTTELLSGNISYYLYTPINNFNNEYYTEAYIDLNNDKSIFSKDYKDMVSKEKKKIEKITSSLGEKRYQDLLMMASYYEELGVDSSKQIKNVSWYTLDIDSNIGFYQFDKDTERITNIAKLFPLVFFIVAVLICLTTMTRMVEEERNQIGTLKALGYSDKSIMFKYILYALLATIIGSIIGVLIGFNIIPVVIYNMYEMLYIVRDFQMAFHFELMLLGTVIAVFCTLGATLYTCIKSLKEEPAELLRPVCPKAGKRVLLERIPFIWNRLSFIKKVTVRNVFRYKKRFLMTIIGISGCTGLILAGFGLKDCITNMVPKQFDEIFLYQATVSLKENITLEQKNVVKQQIDQITGIKDSLKLQKEAVKIKNKKTNQTIQLVVPLDNMDNFIKLQERVSKKQLQLDNNFIVTEKIARLLSLNEDDKIVINGNQEYRNKISGITENYLNHYIYMSKKLYGSEEYNTIVLKTNKMSEIQEKQLATLIKKIDGISSITFNSSSRGFFDNSMQNFSYVSLVLIISAGLLAFVVLYNLASVNISERKRELASIKVLGFYDKEVYKYISRETTILTIIGIIVGIGVGNVLTTFIIKTCELDMIMFDPTITFKSYIYAVIITIFFTFLVNIMVYFGLKKIDMIESLKSVE
ncbi:MAG: FtsX-like permease family protein [Bacilli bacterium]